MGKPEKAKANRKNDKLKLIVSLVILFLLVGALVRAAMSMDRDETGGQTGEETIRADETTAAQDELQGGDGPSDESEKVTAPSTEEQTDEAMAQLPVTLGHGLTIKRIDSYAGIYMEDGSDEVVSGKMMLVLENGAEQDLQLARIYLTYADFTAEFEVTNLPAGQSVLVLEKNRHGAVHEKFVSAEVKNVVFFSEAMSLQEERLEITGGNGYIEVKNISGTDIAGDVYVYYKNIASDMLYGGITYRARIEGGLAAGETMRIMTGHYTAQNSRIVMVTVD